MSRSRRIEKGFIMRPILVFTAALLAACAAGCGGGPEVQWTPPDGYLKNVNQKGQTVILVIDRSLSMRTTDPGNFNIAGAQIAVSMLDDEDNVGVATFADAAEPLMPTRSLGDRKTRAEFSDKLDSIEMTGMATDFTMGLGLAKAFLDPLNLPKEKVSVVFLTDGSHTVLDTKDGIPVLMDEFAAKGWKIFTIAFGSQISSAESIKMLQDLAAKTQGAYFKIEEPRDLPGAFIQIFSHIKDFMTYKGKGDLVVQPLLKRLLYLMIKKKPADSFRSVLRDGKEVDLAAEKAYRYPETQPQEGKISRYEVISLSKPKEGAYSCQHQQGPEVWKLATFPFKVSFAKGSPPAEAVEGNPVEIALDVVCETDEMAAAVRSTGSSRAAFFPAGAGTPAAEIACPALDGKGKTVTFRGSAALALPQKGKPEMFEVKASFGLVDSSGGAWEIQKLATVKITPGPPPLLKITPPQVDFGKIWEDKGPFEISLKLETEVAGGVKVKADGKSDLFAVEPAEIVLQAGSAQTAVIRLNAAKIIETGKRKIAINLGFDAQGGGRSARVVAPVMFDMYSFKGPDRIDFDHVPPGYQISKTVEIEILPPVQNFSAMDAFLKCGEETIQVICLAEKSAESGAPEGGGEGKPADSGSKTGPKDGDSGGRQPGAAPGGAPPGQESATLEDAAGQIAAAGGISVMFGRSADGTLISGKKLGIQAGEYAGFKAAFEEGKTTAAEFLRSCCQATGCSVEALSDRLYRIYSPPVIKMEDFAPDRPLEEIEASRILLKQGLANASLPEIQGDAGAAPGEEPVLVDVQGDGFTIGKFAAVVSGKAAVVVKADDRSAGLAIPVALDFKAVDLRVVLSAAAEQAGCGIRRNGDGSFEFVAAEEKDRDETGDKKPADPAPDSDPGAAKEAGSASASPAPAESGSSSPAGTGGKDEGAKGSEGKPEPAAPAGSAAEPGAGSGAGKEAGAKGADGKPDPAKAPPKEEKPKPPEPLRLKLILSVPTTPATPEGMYEGVLVLEGKGQSPLRREIPLSAPISLPEPDVEFSSDSITGTPGPDGSVAAEITVKLKTPFAAELEIETSDLRPEDPKAGVVSRKFDIRLVPGEGWDGRILDPGKTYRIRYRAFFCTDLGQGTYTGGITLKMKSKGKECSRTLPVSVTVGE